MDYTYCEGCKEQETCTYCCAELERWLTESDLEADSDSDSKND